MIKFWKSAAKGKSGCPVRPPELENASTSHDLLESCSSVINRGFSHTFKNKSKLSLTLHDLLVEKKCLKYFVEYMKSIGKCSLITCWLELEDFKSQFKDKNRNVESHSKLSRTQSVDLNYKTKTSPSFSWKQTKRIPFSTDTSKLTQEDFSSNCQSPFQCDVDDSSNPTDTAISLFKKYIALEASNPIVLPDHLRKSVISNICLPEGNIKKDCFEPVQEVVFNEVENIYFNDFLNSPYYIKAQLEILTSDSLNLEDILYNETILFYFTEYLEQESCRVLLEFLMAVMHFRNNITNGNITKTEQIQDDAIVIYDKFISLQATNSVGIPSEIRIKVESDICTEEGPLPTCFDIPYQIVFSTLTKYVKTFLESELYFKYLSEMIHSVNQMASSARSQSDCSSEISISSRNTLLAMGDPVFHKTKRNHSVPDMTIDLNQLYNADALWQRKKHEGLNLGRVNSLGRFESKFEPDPDKKDRSVLKKMVSKFVPTNTAKVEEEMAWQVAHMIVKDVTDLTMAPAFT